jgi:predicted metal-dependent hydrolase
MSATVPTRRIAFEYPTAGLPRYFVSGDVVMSHVVAMLSAMFPDGEDFFVRSVRSWRDDITDPTLREQVKGFIGQESMHGREHRELNERLAAMGYPTKGVERIVDRSLRFRERIQGRRANLAVTAALEHYTATLAETLLSNEQAREMFDVPEVRSLFLWHALEESEHKAVAFDVYRHAAGGERLRCVMMNVTTVFFLVALVASTTLSVLMDPIARRHPVRLVRSLARLRRSPFINRDVARRIRDYNRPGFHPDDNDATELVERWRCELFGADGSLNPRLRSADRAIS